MIRGLHINIQKVRFYNSVVVLNAAALFFIAYLFQPFDLMRPMPQRIVYAAQLPVVPDPALPLPISGKPNRIEIIQANNGLHVDLPVKDGFYDPASETWTLNQNDAFFAMLSVPVNDTRGTTMIYGHNEANVFGHLAALHQGVGTYALVYTDTGKVFRYLYRDSTDLKPDDVSVFTNDGPPTLVVQTCSGSWFELRRLYRFSFDRLEPML